jgi:hypothetical protein
MPSVMNNYDTTFTQNHFPGTLFSWCAITLDGLCFDNIGLSGDIYCYSIINTLGET